MQAIIVAKMRAAAHSGRNYVATNILSKPAELSFVAHIRCKDAIAPPAFQTKRIRP